ncbi:MAG TPA: response regulator transcription factor [Planctomycetaceae bacterium]|nr:response regulator transcription factor [Planctomycetaceae bacterium]
MRVQLLIADDHKLVREGLRMTFAGSGIEIVAEAASGEEAFEKLQQHAADVALVDVRMPESDGYRFLELIRAAGLSLPVVMHTIQSGAETIRRCRELGAVGLVAKGEEPDVLRDAVRAASAGRQFWDGSASHEIGGGGAAFA